MLSAWEIAANKALALPGMQRRVLGCSADDYDELRQSRLDQMRAALHALRAAVGTPRIIPGEWDDDALAVAAVRVDSQIARETARVGKKQIRTTSSRPWASLHPMADGRWVALRACGPHHSPIVAPL